MSFKDVPRVIRQRWVIFLPVAALVVGSHLAWVAFGQRQSFRAAATVAFNPPGGSGFPSAKNLAPAGGQAIPETPLLTNALQLLEGERPFTSPAFREPSRQAEIKSFTGRFAAEVKAGRGAPLLIEIEDSIDATMEGDGGAITIEAASADPKRAVAISWAVAEGARILHNDRLRARVDDSVAELAAQRSRLEADRAQVQKDRLEFAKRTGLTNLPGYRDLVQRSILQLDGEATQLEGERSELGRRIDERISRTDQGRDEVGMVAEDAETSGRLNQLQEELVTARRDYEASLSRLGVDDATVQELKAKLEKLERRVSEEQEAILSGGLEKWNAATRELVKQASDLALKQEVLKGRKASLTRELFRLGEVGQEYDRLEERAATAAAGLDRVKGRLGELEWARVREAGQAQVWFPSDSAVRVRKRGAGPVPVAFALLVALAFAAGVVWALEYFDARVRTEEDVRRYLGLPLLGAIPEGRSPLIIGEGTNEETSEKFNTAATLIRSAARQLGMKSLMVTSAVAGEGKTTVTVNLGVALARKGSRVILVDGDLRAPSLHKLLGLPNHCGVSTLLQSQLDAGRVAEGILPAAARGESLDAQKALNPTAMPGLWVLTSGPPPEAPVKLLESDRLPLLVRELKAAADFVIFDTPPVTSVGDALSIAEVVDGSILVVGCGICEHPDVSWSKHLLSNVQTNVLGVFLNRFARRSAGRYYGYHRSAQSELGNLRVTT